MSLRDLLPDGTFDEIAKEAHHKSDEHKNTNGPLMVRCPVCHKVIVYSKDNAYRPFCSERCKLIDLGAWANEEICVAGKDVNEDEDADLLNDLNLPKRNFDEKL